MARRSAPAAGCIVLLAMFASGVAEARANDTNVTVLGIRSIEGDDDFARSLTVVLRNAADRMPGWELNPRDVSLSQMLLVLGCEETDPSCMTSVAESIGTQRLLYGTIRRTGTDEQYGFALNLHLFDAETSQVVESLTDILPRNRTDVDALRVLAQRYIVLLRGRFQTGVLRVKASSGRAEVRLDDQVLGLVDDDGDFVSMDVPVGPHEVAVVGDQGKPYRQTVEIVAGEESRVVADAERTSGADEIGASAPLPGDEPLVASPASGPHAKGSLPAWVGWTVLGVGVASLGATVYGWSRLSAIGEASPVDLFGENDMFRRYREGLATDQDACAEARRGSPGGAMLDSDELARMRGLCNEADFWETAQYIFLGVGVAAVATGSYLILSRRGGKADQGPKRPVDKATLALQPSFGPHGARIGARVRF